MTVVLGEDENAFLQALQGLDVKKMEVFSMVRQTEEDGSCVTIYEEEGTKAEKNPAFNGYYQISPHIKVWQPTNEEFLDKEAFKRYAKEHSVYRRYHIWFGGEEEVKKAEKQLKEVGFSMKECWLYTEHPFYTHTEEIAVTSAKVLRGLSFGCALVCGAGWILYLYLSMEKGKENYRLFQKLGGKKKTYFTALFLRIFLLVSVGFLVGYLLYNFMDHLLLSIADESLRIPEDFFERKAVVWDVFVKAGGILFFAGMTAGCVRSGLERKVRTAAGVAATALAVLLLIVTGMLQNNFVRMEKEIFEKRKQYDVLVAFDSFLNKKELKSYETNPLFQKAEPIVLLWATVKNKEKEESLTVMGITPETGLIGLSKEEQDALLENQILLPKWKAEGLCLLNEDEFAYEAEYKEKVYEGFAKVGALTNQQMEFQAFFEADSFQYADAILLKTEKEKEALKWLNEREHAAAIVKKEQEHIQWKNRMGKVKEINDVFLFLSVITVILLVSVMFLDAVETSRKKRTVLEKLGENKMRQKMVILRYSMMLWLPGFFTGIAAGMIVGEGFLRNLSTSSVLFLKCLSVYGICCKM